MSRLEGIRQRAERAKNTINDMIVLEANRATQTDPIVADIEPTFVQDIPYLLERVSELEAENERLREELREFHEPGDAPDMPESAGPGMWLKLPPPDDAT